MRLARTPHEEEQCYGNLLYFRIKGVLKLLETLRDLDVICHIKMAGNHDGEVSAFSFY